MMVGDRENGSQQIENGQISGSAADLKPLTPAARRALAEAEQRRLAVENTRPASKEISGRDGPEPVRYGDWEVKGLATDF